MKPNRPQRLLIVEEALRSVGFGHWYEYIKTIAEGCRNEGVEVELLVHKDAETTIIETLRAQQAGGRLVKACRAHARHLTGRG